jgi:hypothetical protein
MFQHHSLWQPFIITKNDDDPKSCSQPLTSEVISTLPLSGGSKTTLDLHLGHRAATLRCRGWLGPDDFVEAFDDPLHFFWGGAGKLLPNAFNSQRPNLADFHPRPGGEPWGAEFEC